MKVFLQNRNFRQLTINQWISTVGDTIFYLAFLNYVADASFAVWLDNDRFHKVFWNGLDILYDVSLHSLHLLGYSSACFME